MLCDNSDVWMQDELSSQKESKMVRCIVTTIGWVEDSRVARDAFLAGRALGQPAGPRLGWSGRKSQTVQQGAQQAVILDKDAGPSYILALLLWG
jgi:hypothetical protein